MREARLGYCVRCGDRVRPVFCLSDITKQQVLSHGICGTCDKQVIVSEFTVREYLQLPIIPVPVRKVGLNNAV